MSLGDERELVPLGAGFDLEKRGYDRVQVDEHLERLDADLKMLTSDRDAAISQAGDLARQLEIARGEIDDLRGQVERLAQPPTTLEGLSERLQRMLRLAQDEAADTRARAEAEAGHIRAKAESDASAMRARYEELLTELAERRKEMEAEHRSVLETARAEAATITSEAAAERDRLDSEAEQRRTQVEDDFEIAMAGRRTEAMRVLAEQEAASKAEAERRVREATEEAAGIRTKVAEEEAAAKADIDRRQRESVADANQRKQNSISEANARVAEASDEARRRVREATDQANRRIAHAAERVQALRSLRATIAEQVRGARAMLAEADTALTNAAAQALPDDDYPTVQTTPSPTPKPAPATGASKVQAHGGNNQSASKPTRE
ncbi:chromosome segregation protein [Amycolatopsis palatopharyngis]|uniref:chromosome segregation protein n=1 Tax=Amycolatopsis palatopharyngis TaxID=187982 RepID=UPI001FEB4218|nr:chromosome segregation protein [Amycolatopsis palatopharyngis]